MSNAQTIIRVQDVMTPGVRTIDAMASVRHAVSVMRALDVSSLVVERRDDDDEIGMLVVSDIARDVIGKNLSPDRVNVSDVMSKPVMTLAAEMNVVYAVRLLTRFQLTRSVVIDHRRQPVGIVTLRDMVLRQVGEA
jgi:predicted transcriptional regulator